MSLDQEIRAAQKAVEVAGGRLEKAEQFRKTAHAIGTNETVASNEVIAEEINFKQTLSELGSLEAQKLAQLAIENNYRLGKEITAEQQRYEALSNEYTSITSDVRSWFDDHAKEFGAKLKTDLITAGVSENTAEEIKNKNTEIEVKTGERVEASLNDSGSRFIQMVEKSNLSIEDKEFLITSLNSTTKEFTNFIKEKFGEAQAELADFLVKEKLNGKTDEQIKKMAEDRGLGNAHMVDAQLEMYNTTLGKTQKDIEADIDHPERLGQTMDDFRLAVQNQTLKTSLSTSFSSVIENRMSADTSMGISVNSKLLDSIKDETTKSNLTKLVTGTWLTDDAYSSYSTPDYKMHTGIIDKLTNEKLQLTLSYNDIKLDIGDDGKLKINIDKFDESSVSVNEKLNSKPFVGSPWITPAFSPDIEGLKSVPVMPTASAAAAVETATVAAAPLAAAAVAAPTQAEAEVKGTFSVERQPSLLSTQQNGKLAETNSLVFTDENGNKTVVTENGFEKNKELNEKYKEEKAKKEEKTEETKIADLAKGTKLSFSGMTYGDSEKDNKQDTSLEASISGLASVSQKSGEHGVNSVKKQDSISISDEKLEQFLNKSNNALVV